MKCTNNRRIRIVAAITLCVMLCAGCGSQKPAMEYDYQYPVSSFKIVNVNDTEVADSFASDLCVSGADYTENTDVDMTKATAAGLFSVETGEVLYAKNLFTRLNPASLTKVMTALVALEYGQPEMVLTASASINNLEAGASTCGLRVGDTMTLDQALNALLICSANDAAIMIAEGIGGSIEGFATLMNEEAQKTGATNCNFSNPHGLTEDNHLVTAYDMYLIFNKALSFDKFYEIISRSSYSTIYSDSKGTDIELSINTTNQYLNGTFAEPEKITVIGGKTGTTNAAGQCLILLSKDIYGNSYISIILGSSERTVLYEQMTDLLNEIYN